MNRLLSSRLAAHGHARQVEAALATDRIGASTDAAVARIWQQLLAVLRTASNPVAAQAAAARILAGLLPALGATLQAGFTRLTLQTHRHAAAATLKTLPPAYLAAALRRRARRASPGLRESRELLEDIRHDDGQPGFVALGLGPGGFEAEDRLEPIRIDPHSDATRELIDRLLFPPPSETDAFNVVRSAMIGGKTWSERLDAVGQHYPPLRLAHLIATSYAEGLNQRQIAQRLRPALDATQSACRRLARTYGMAIAHETQQAVTGQLGDLVIGQQVHATLDHWTRPEHRQRDGTIYYIHPGPGQKGMNECPHPPLEADGSIAWNCRCYLTPVLRPLQELEQPGPRRDVFLQNRLLPDPLTYRDWFAAADVQRRRLSVGARRYNTAREVLGHPPAYEDLVGLDGRFLSPAELRDETPIQREERVAKVRVDMLRRGEAQAQTATFGFAR